MTTAYRPPTLEKVTDKVDALDWSTLPDETCDLNYRSTKALPRNAAIQTLIGLALVPVLALPALLLVRQGFVSVASPAAAVIGLSLSFGSLLALVRRRPAARQALPLALAPVVLWLLFRSLPLHEAPALSVLLLMGLVLPAVAWLADAAATHAAFWMSAHHRIDHATMMAWRADWRQRFGQVPARPPRRDDLPAATQLLHGRGLTARRAYHRGFVWFVPGISLTGAAVTTAGQLQPRPAAGLTLGLAILGLLLLASVVRNRSAPRAWRLAFSFLTHFAGYGLSAPSPPWGFHSPAGGVGCRLGMALFVQLAVTVCWLPLVDFGRALLEDPAGRADLSASSSLLAVWGKAVHGDVTVAARAALHYAFLVGSPGLFLYLSLCFLAGPSLAAHHRALETPEAYEQHPDWSWLDGYSERLRHSANPKERESLLAGRHPEYDYAVLVHSKLLFEHVHLLGATGAGKTALGLLNHTIQLIRRGDGAVLVLDCKGDPAFFHTVVLEARRQGRPVKWFTNQLGRATYVFNPFDPEMYRTQSLQDIVGLLMNALNLHHGSDYGRAWFTIANRILLKRSLEETRRAAASGARAGRWHQKFEEVQSFRDLNDIILYLAADGKEFQAAQHLAFLVESLAEFEPLNLAPRRDRAHPALAHAINMSEVLRDRQVIYFYLVGAIDLMSVAELGRLALYCLLNACIQHKERYGETPRAYALVDEAQALIGQNIQHVLAQARSHGMACFLAHQTMSQLNPPGGVDLRELVLSCTSVKQIFSARDPWLQKYISDMSGRVRYANYAYRQRTSHLAWGRHHVALALPDEDGRRSAQVSEVVAPRLGPQDFLEVNHNDNLCLLAIERAEAFSRWHGFAPVHLDWPMPEPEYRRRRDDIAWPAADQQTLATQPEWPAPNAATVVATHHPPITEEADPQGNNERLRQLRRTIEGDA